MKRPSRWAWFWIGIGLAILIGDIIASKPPHKKPRSLSEYLGHLFPRGWKRAVLIAIMALAFWHIATQPEYVPVQGMP